MPTLTRDSRFFGLDLSTLGRDLRAAWDDARRWPALSWLTPEAPVRLLHADGRESLWLGAETLRPAPGDESRKARFTAVELPEDLVLRRNLVMPAMSDDEIAGAVALDVDSASPFPPGDTVWGHALQRGSGAECQVACALASRKQVERHLKSLQSRFEGDADAGGASVELWALAGASQPIVMRGFGEARRARQAASGRKLSLILVFIAALLLLAMAVTPTAQLRLRAIEAVNAFTALSHRTAPLAAKREALVNASDRLGSLREIVAGRVDPLRVLDLLTRVLPDETSLLSVQIEGLKVSIAGQAENSARLMQTLGATAGLRDVRAPTAATRALGSPKESFNIEFTLDPKEFEVAAQSPAAAAEPAARETAAASPVASPAAPAAEPASHAAQPAAPPQAVPASASPSKPKASPPMPSGRDALLMKQPKP